MTVERKFVQQGLNRSRMDEYFAKELERAGYAGMEINRTPMGTQITIFAEKPGMVIGKGGKVVRKLTKDLDMYYDLDNPQIDVQNVGVPELNAQLMASRIASALERGWYFRKAAHSTLRRIMDSGALGCRIVLSGKLTGPRSRIEKVVQGYIVHAGKPAEEIVHHGFATAVQKLGTIGCSIQIVLPDTVLPDVFNLVEVEPPEQVPVEETEITTVEEMTAGEITAEEITAEEITAEEMIGSEVELIGAEIPDRTTVEEVAPSAPTPPSGGVITEPPTSAVEGSVTTDATKTKSPVETKGIPPKELTETPPTVEAEGTPTKTTPVVETRNVDGVWQHKHDDYDWHVMAVVHKQAESGEQGEMVRVKDGVTEHKHGNFDYWHPVSRVHKGG